MNKTVCVGLEYCCPQEQVTKLPRMTSLRKFIPHTPYLQTAMKVQIAHSDARLEQLNNLSIIPFKSIKNRA